MRLYGKPQFIRADNDAEFTAAAVMRWLREQCPTRVWSRDLREAMALIETWRQFYNHRRPHSVLGYQPRPCSLPKKVGSSLNSPAEWPQISDTSQSRPTPCDHEVHANFRRGSRRIDALRQSGMPSASVGGKRSKVSWR